MKTKMKVICFFIMVERERTERVYLLVLLCGEFMF